MKSAATILITSLLLFIFKVSAGFIVDNSESTKCVLNSRVIPKNHPLSCTEGPAFEHKNTIEFSETKDNILQISFQESNQIFEFENYCIDRQRGKNEMRLCDSTAFIKICCVFPGKSRNRCVNQDLDFDFSSKIVDTNKFYMGTSKIEPVYCDLNHHEGKQLSIQQLYIEDPFLIFQNGSLKLPNSDTVHNDYCLELGSSKILAFLYDTPSTFEERLVLRYSRFLMPALFVLFQFVVMICLLVIVYFYWEKMRARQKLIAVVN